MRNVRFEFLQRFATEDRVVDESLVTFEIAKAGYWPFAQDEKIEMRLGASRTFSSTTPASTSFYHRVLHRRTVSQDIQH
jgi:hypothetical protein